LAVEDASVWLNKITYSCFTYEGIPYMLSQHRPAI